MPWENEYTIISYEEPIIMLLSRVGLFQDKKNGLYVACDKLGQNQVLTVVQEVTRSDVISSARVYIFSDDKSIAQLMFRHFMDRTKASETVLMDEHGRILNARNDACLKRTAEDIVKNIESLL